MGPSIISIFDFLLNDHYAQVKSTLQDLFRRSTSLNHGNHSPSTLKTPYCTVPIVQTCRLNPLTPRLRSHKKRAPLGDPFRHCPCVNSSSIKQDVTTISNLNIRSFLFHISMTLIPSWNTINNNEIPVLSGCALYEHQPPAQPLIKNVIKSKRARCLLKPDHLHFIDGTFFRILVT